MKIKHLPRQLKSPIGKKTVGGIWVYSIKRNADGREKYKATFVAKCYSKKMGIYYGETFSSTANMMIVSVLLEKAAQDNLIINQMEVKTTYLRAPIDHDKNINPPEGYEEASDGLVHKLEKSVCGLKQSGQNWNRVLHNCLNEYGFAQNQADYRVYAKESNNEKVIFIIWVDDLIIAATNDTILREVKEILAGRFKMKDLGRLRHFLGIDTDQSDGCIKMTQEKYTNKILEHFKMQNCRSRETPCDLKKEYTRML